MTHRAEASVPECADTKDLLSNPARASAHWVDEDSDSVDSGLTFLQPVVWSLWFTLEEDSL